MAGLDWSAPLPKDVGQHEFRSQFPEVFGGGEKSPPPVIPKAAPAAPVEQPASEPGKPDYAAMPWSEVGSRAVSNLLPSAASAIKGVGSAIYNYEDTASALNELGKGAVSKVKGALGFERNPEAERVVDALGQMYAGRYGTMAGFKEALAEDPFSIGMDVASVAPGIGLAGRAAKLGPVAKGLEKVAALGDPVNVAAKGVSLAGKTVAKPVMGAARYGQGVASGVPVPILKLAEEAGRSGTPIQRNAFLTFASGKGDHRDIAKAAMDAVDELRQKTSADYISRKAALTTQELPMDEITNALSKLKMELDPHGVGLFPGLSNAISEIERQVAGVARSANPAARSAEGLDRLKRSLNDVVREFRGTQHVGALGEIPKAVRNTISSFDSGYAEMMDRWEKWRNELLDFQRTLGTTDKAAESARLAKLLSTARKEDKMSLLRELADNTEAGHALPYMIAGATVENALPPYIQGAGLAGLGVIAAGGPHGALTAAAGSPRIAGLTNYAAGRIMSAADRLPSAPPAIATNVLSQIGNERIGRKTGGRVGVSHGRIADQLVAAAERAKKGISEDTKPLLNASDDHIAHALEVANRSI